MSLTDKDREAISHIASVSKHPHAARIVEWLITGCDVERKINDKLIIEWFPSWFPHDEYRLVYPKIKPAYRVYRLSDGLTSTIDRMQDGTLTNTNPNLPWVSDWIEYDEPTPKKWPTPLIERIAAIDIKAAEWIVDNWDDLLEDRYTNKGRYSRNSNRLISMFSWNDSDNSYDWNDISNRLGEQ